MPTFNRALQDGYNLQLVITQTSQNIAANTSTISGTLRVQRPSNQADYTAYDTVWSTSINGVAANGTTSGYDFSSYATLTLRSWTQTIAHDSDGTKSFTVAGAWRETDPYPTVGYTTAVQASGTVTLTTIPRTSQVTLSDSDFDAGTTITINTNRASTSFTHDVKYSFGGLTNQTSGLADSTSIGASTTFTPPLSLLNQIPNNTSGTGTITVTTKSGSTVIGSDSVNFTLRAPSSVKPTISSVTHSEAVALVDTEVGAYVKNLTKLNVGISGEAGAYGSTISTRKITVAGQTINADSGTTGLINASGTVPIVATVTDSRGRTASLTQNVTVLDYTPPAITSLTVQRSNISGTPQADGTTIKVNAVANTKSLINTTERNNIYYTLYVRQRGTTSWGTPKIPKTAVGYSTSAGKLNWSGFLLTSTYAIEDSWDVRLDISDDFSTISSTAIVATAAIDVHFDANLGVGIGKFREDGMLDVAGTVRIGATGDASPTSTTHSLQIGPTSGVNLRADGNEIMAVNNGAASTLGLNQDGGNVSIGDSGSTVTAAGYLRATGTGDASLTSTTHPMQLGPTSGANLAIDSNELQGRNNGAAATIGLNGGGGDVNIGHSSYAVRVQSPNIQWANATGSVSVAASGVTSVTFPAGRFSVAPRVVTQIISGQSTVSVTWVTSITSTGFDIRCYTLAGTQVAATCAWIAFQQASGAANG